MRAVDADASSRFGVDLELAAEAYGRKTETLKAELGMRSIPTAGPDLAEFVGRAAHRTPPFEEFARGKGAAVTGFQDAVILFSIISHLADNPCTAAFASQDAVFSGVAVKSQIRERGVDLRVYERLKVLGDELWERVAPAIR